MAACDLGTQRGARPEVKGEKTACKYTKSASSTYGRGLGPQEEKINYDNCFFQVSNKIKILQLMLT